MSRKRLVYAAVLFLSLLVISLGSYGIVRLMNSNHKTGNNNGSLRADGEMAVKLNNDSRPVDHVLDETIDSDAMIITRVNYTKGDPYVIETSAKAGSDIIGMTGKEAGEYYKKLNFLIVGFNSKKLILEKTVNEWPPSSYVVKIENDRIKIYQSDEKGRLTYKQEVNLAPSQLSGDIKAYVKGKTYKNMEDIEQDFDEYDS